MTVHLTEVADDLHLLATDPSNAYLWVRDREVTLFDTGLPGSDRLVLEALHRLGLDRSALVRVVLTHWHADHSGGAAAIAAWGDVEVCVGRADAAVVRGDVVGPPPELTDAERPLFARVSEGQPPAPPTPVHRELIDGDAVDGEGLALVVVAPGHTAGSLGVHLPGPRVLITGDSATASADEVSLGPFNVDRDQAWRSLRRLAALDVDIACFGHGPPVLTEASRALATATDPLGGTASRR